jgi:hypothetical protein
MAYKTFAICMNNKDNEASLERWKIYEVLMDEKAELHNLIRIIDESGEDYLYPADSFAIIDLPKAVQDVMISERAL